MTQSVLIAFVLGLLSPPVMFAIWQLVYVSVTGHKWLSQYDIKLTQLRLRHRQAIRTMKQEMVHKSETIALLTEELESMEADNKKLVEALDKFTTRLQKAEEKLGR